MRAALTILLLLQPSPASAEPQTQVFAEILATHNRLRAEHALPPLVWSETLSASASAYAAVLARTNSFQHDPTPGRRKREGENLWMGPRGVYGPATMTAGFLREGRLFRRGIYPDVSASGNWLDVAHYTQIIWPTTTAVGCGLVSNAWSDFLVCRYAPPGNKDGRAVR